MRQWVAGAARRARSFAALSTADKLRVVEIAATMLATKAALRIAPQIVLSRSLALKAEARCEHPSNEFLTLVHRVARSLPCNINCLPRSLALQALMRRRRVDTELMIGAQRVDSALRGHAWIQCAHGVLGDSPDVAQDFPPLTVTAASVATWIGSARL